LLLVRIYAFDYGVAYFMFRGTIPAPGTESRSLELPSECRSTSATNVPPVTPSSPDEILELLKGTDDADSKKASLMRVLDFYATVVCAEEDDLVDMPVSLHGRRQTISYADVSLDFLCEVLSNLWAESQEQENAG
jgi:hypothetical protein